MWLNGLTDILHILPISLEAATGHWRMMVWNTWLALIPLTLADYLFHRNSQRTALWWLGALVFIAFLPNAPYVLTDIIHLIEDIRYGYSMWIVALVLVPQYLLFMLIGFAISDCSGTIFAAARFACCWWGGTDGACIVCLGRISGSLSSL